MAKYIPIWLESGIINPELYSIFLSKYNPIIHYHTDVFRFPIVQVSFYDREGGERIWPVPYSSFLEAMWISTDLRKDGGVDLLFRVSPNPRSNYYVIAITGEKILFATRITPKLELFTIIEPMVNRSILYLQVHQGGYLTRDDR